MITTVRITDKVFEWRELILLKVWLHWGDGIRQDFLRLFISSLGLSELSRGVLYVSMVLAALVFKVELISTLVWCQWWAVLHGSCLLSPLKGGRQASVPILI